MNISAELRSRSNNSCELCGNAGKGLTVYNVPPKTENIPDSQVVLCSDCYEAVKKGDFGNTNHWRCLTGSIWSETPAVQVLSYKILDKLSSEDWAAEAVSFSALDDSLTAWANAEAAGALVHKDSFGNVLEQGDTVILTQNLNVKGASFIAPKGTIVRKIRLVRDNEEQIEGKINGDTIVILTKFVKRSAS